MKFNLVSVVKMSQASFMPVQAGESMSRHSLLDLDDYVELAGAL